MQLTDLGLVSILSDTCELMLTWGEHHEHMGTLTRMDPHRNIAELCVQRQGVQQQQ